MYRPTELLILFYSEIKVGRRITAEEADGLNSGNIPWQGVLTVSRPKNKVHYFSKCNGRATAGIARTIQDTTCKHCLLDRARQLRGLRWTHPHNTAEVAFLTSALGSRVEGFNAPQQGDDILAQRLGIA